MTKRGQAAAHDAAVSHAAPTSIAAADNESAQRFLAEGRRAAPNSEGPKVPPRVMIDQARVLLQIPTEAQALTAALAAGGFEFGVIAGLAWVAEQLAGTIKPTPADRRKTTLLTPAQKADVADAAKKLSRDLEAIHAIGRVTGRLDEARALGLASDVGRSPSSVSAAYQTFLSLAASNGALLKDAGITAKKLAAREAALKKLEAIGTAKVKSKTNRSATSLSIKELALALECGFGFYRALAISALEEDPDSIPTALGYIPRAADRRNAAPKGTDEEADEDEAGEGGGEGAATDQPDAKSEGGASEAGEPVKGDGQGDLGGKPTTSK